MKHLFKTTTFNVVKTRLTGQPFFYTSFFSLIALGLIIGNFVFGWIPPTATPPSSNLPAPINVSSTEQTKAGNLIIGGVLRLGQFATAPSGTEGALYYNTTEKKTKVYSNTTWSDLGGGAVPGLLPNYTTTQRNALSPTTGQQIYNTTENKVQVYGSGAWIAVSAKLALAATCTSDGDCDSVHCVDGVCCDTLCNASICQRCDSYSNAGAGTCGYISTAVDPNNECGTTICYSGNCSGTGFTCGYNTSGDGECPTCQTCVGATSSSCVNYTAYNEDTGCSSACIGCSGGSCGNIPNASQDTWGANTCTTTHYRCNGSGGCTSPTYTGKTTAWNAQTCSAICPSVYGAKLIGCIRTSCNADCSTADADCDWVNGNSDCLCCCNVYTY